MKNLKTFEVISQNGKSHFISAKTKKSVTDFWVSEKPKRIIERKDIDPKSNIVTD